MLILTRKLDESIEIDGGIRIVVLAVESLNRVKLGIEAPAGVRIFRAEIPVERRREAEA